jgi:hypothetical protein
MLGRIAEIPGRLAILVPAISPSEGMNRTHFALRTFRGVGFSAIDPEKSNFHRGE